MNHPFNLDVFYNDQIISFPAELQHSEYYYRIVVIISDIPVIFEQDEEGGYRAIIKNTVDRQKVSQSLLHAIADELRKTLSI
ncbi:MAG: hypothetical protein QM802_02440 [Agriterribacter sp.]